MTSPTAKKSKYSLPLWARLAVGVSLFAVLGSQMDSDALGRVIQRVSMQDFASLVFCFVLFNIVSAYRWFGLLRCLDRAVSFLHVLRISFISVFVGSLMPGSIGVEMSRIAGVVRCDVTLTKAVFSVALDRLLGSVTLSLLVLAGILFGSRNAEKPVMLADAIILGGVVLLAVGVTNPHVRKWSSNFLKKRLGKLFRARFRRVVNCVDAYREQPKIIVKTLLISFGTQMIRVACVWLGTRALAIQVPFTYLLIIVPLIMFLLMLPVTIGGLGVREAGYVYFLGVIGIIDESAFTLSIMLYLAFLCSTLPGGCLLVLGRRGNKLAEKSASAVSPPSAALATANTSSLKAP